MRTKINSETFLTIEQAFDLALENIKGKYNDDEKGKIYVWRQRYKDGKLSHKKIWDILESAGFKKVVEERWIALNDSGVQKENKEEELVDNEPFKD